MRESMGTRWFRRDAEPVGQPAAWLGSCSSPRLAVAAASFEAELGFGEVEAGG
jgi:hypothetical protein